MSASDARRRVVEHLDLAPQAVAHVGRLLLLDEGRLGEILAVLAERQLRFLGPALLELVEAGDLAAHLLLVGDRARGARADLDQGLLHLEDDHPDHLRRIFRLIEKIREVRRDDVARAGENTHSITPYAKVEAAAGKARGPALPRRRPRVRPEPGPKPVPRQG